jgi:hypothetical protein
MTIANIGETLPNSDSKMFEVQIKLDGSDPLLRPSMTTGNKIIIESYPDAIFIPSECVQAGIDSIPFVYQKNKKKQIVLLGKSNDKNVMKKALSQEQQYLLSLLKRLKTSNFQERSLYLK